ncbi:hypothetical protein [Shewanella baltica]|uniref:hypothetical protein n=1 Tax=Shewanella baltica TaxID=62322 RepID=UPI00217EDB18|nr:hypothetical protein [Shewanella baltica]
MRTNKMLCVKVDCQNFIPISLLDLFKKEQCMPNIYRTVSHVGGWQGLPQYEIKGDKIYRTVSHVDGWQGLPQYEIKGNNIYRTVSHVDGWQGLPQYE